MKIQITKVRENAKLPTRGSDAAAGYDLYACKLDTKSEKELERIQIRPLTTVMIGTGIAVAIPEGYFGGIYARSGMATKQSLWPANCVGVIDSDYRGELIVALHNGSDKIQEVNVGDRIGQLIVQPFESVEFEEVEALEETERGEGGFGSTGVD